ncbi:hypothetical protein PSMK_09220 [Phycisphaera mikurensis NBRC 102666]|uniref:Uncharacterized protein n=1 Tax=Phycisphaera mikurensis (strain NBRC 102666 / KCTC 22515 / FYK2301M01) TaxID=1142394 RepID=I0ICU3_PHYMF|nr:hypothetical protein PSMK_09220 [Phycisphaera mikurensis NBRC 102666]
MIRRPLRRPRDLQHRGLDRSSNLRIASAYPPETEPPRLRRKCRGSNSGARDAPTHPSAGPTRSP